MKSPWKIITRLMSGREVQEVSQPRAADSGRAVESAQDLRQVAEPSSQSVQRPVEAISVDTDGEKTVIPKAGIGISGLGANIAEPTQAVSSIKPIHARESRRSVQKAAERIPRQYAKRKRSTTGSATVRSSASSENGTLPIRQPDSFEAEIVDVDADLRVLSRQLAEKLRQQNEQLRKMLERFGGE